MSALSIAIPEAIRERAEKLAAAEGVSLDQFVASVLRQSVAFAEADTSLRERAARGSRETFLRLLAKAPDVEPDECDRLPPEHAR